MSSAGCAEVIQLQRLCLEPGKQQWPIVYRRLWHCQSSIGGNNSKHGCKLLLTGRASVEQRRCPSCSLELFLDGKGLLSPARAASPAANAGANEEFDSNGGDVLAAVAEKGQ